MRARNKYGMSVLKKGDLPKPKRIKAHLQRAIALRDEMLAVNDLRTALKKRPSRSRKTYATLIAELDEAIAGLTKVREKLFNALFRMVDPPE